MCICVYAYVCVCMCSYIYIYVVIYIYIYIRTSIYVSLNTYAEFGGYLIQALWTDRILRGLRGWSYTLNPKR